MIIRFFFFSMVFLFLTHLYANDTRNMVREGNRLFEEERYAEAEAKYREALELDAENADALFNLGNALYRQGLLEEAQRIFESLSRDFEDGKRLSDALHNLGNSFLGQQRIPESMEAYKDALRISPDQEDTRYNLAYARRLLEEMPPQDQPQAGDGSPDDDAGEDHEGDGPKQPEQGDDQESDDDPDGEEQPATPEPGPMDEMDDDSPARPDALTKEDAGRMLDALRREEERIQQEVNRDDTIPDTLRIEKEW